jgi:hypothetical protein
MMWGNERWVERSESKEGKRGDTPFYHFFPWVNDDHHKKTIKVFFTTTTKKEMVFPVF